MITFREMMDLLNGELLTPGIDLDFECPLVFASDLMSDVLAFMNPGSILLTGLTNSHVVRTACVADISAVVFVQGKRPDEETVAQALQSGLPLVSTSLPTFEACLRMAEFFPVCQAR
jgi:predicted transcriptional regulator